MTLLKNPLAQLDLDLGRHPIPPPAGIFYVAQANYILVPMFQSVGPRYLYSDSATSCIIMIGTGKDHNENWIASLAHLDSPDCIQEYFDTILDKNYVGQVDIYAQGANPPGNKSSEENATMLQKCLDVRMKEHSWNPNIQHLGLKEGDPRRKDRGEYGISLTSDVPVISTQPLIWNFLTVIQPVENRLFSALCVDGSIRRFSYTTPRHPLISLLLII